MRDIIRTLCTTCPLKMSKLGRTYQRQSKQLDPDHADPGTPRLSFGKSGCKSLLWYLVHPFTQHTLSDLQSFIKWEFKHQKRSLNFFCVSYLSNSMLFDFYTRQDFRVAIFQWTLLCWRRRWFVLLISSKCWGFYFFRITVAFFLWLILELHCQYILDISKFVQPLAKFAKISMVVTFALSNEKPLSFQFSW